MDPSAILCRSLYLMIWTLCWCRVAAAVQRTVVLSNGNVLQGEVQRLAEQVVVRTANSEIRIPVDHVDFISRSLQEAYRVRAGRVSTHAQSRAELIQWCLRAGLPREAAHQLEQLRALTPDAPELEALGHQVRTYRKSRQTLLPNEFPVHQDTQLARNRLDRLSEGTVSGFVRSVQPLLINRCGLATCHGRATSTSFTLMGHGQSALPTRHTQRNLGALIRLLEDVPIQQSALWTSAISPHGGMSRRAMTADELLRLSEWIRVVKFQLEGPATSSEIGRAPTSAPPSDPFDPASFNQGHHPPVEPDRHGRREGTRDSIPASQGG